MSYIKLKKLGLRSKDAKFPNDNSNAKPEAVCVTGSSYILNFKLNNLRLRRKEGKYTTNNFDI
jgi:hypothetical protein